MENMLSKEEFDELQMLVIVADNHYRNQYCSPETRDDWYAGITGQGKDEEFELERIKDHHNSDYPNLDTDSIGFWEVSSADVAIEVEKHLEKLGFDTGGSHQPPKDTARIYVYIFRKVKRN